jgi:hypothetical protein
MPTGTFARTKEHNQNISNALKGRKFTKEWIAKIVKAKTGVKLKPLTAKHKKLISIRNTGKGNSHWNGGKRITKDGYINIYKPDHPFCGSDGAVLEHRLIMEKHMGRFLNPKEVMHHINGLKFDNRIKNLILCKNQAEHNGFHNHSRHPQEAQL